MDDACNKMPKAVVLAGVALALGLILGAYVLGMHTRNIGSGRASVSVKGLAEKPVKADVAEWRLVASANGGSFADALEKLRKEKVLLDGFLEKQGFPKDSRRQQEESVEPRYVEKELKDRTIHVQEGYTAQQEIIVSSKDLQLVSASQKAALDFKAAGRSIHFDKPNYLVSNLEDIKMSLIGAATENAKLRANEFVKHSDANLGSMRSASQGAFYILPNTADAKTDDYGGAYDKSTIDKVARVVVTVEFNLK